MSVESKTTALIKNILCTYHWLPGGRPPGHPRDFVFKIKQKPTKAPGYGAEMHDKCPSPQVETKLNETYLYPQNRRSHSPLGPSSFLTLFMSHTLYSGIFEGGKHFEFDKLYTS